MTNVSRKVGEHRPIDATLSDISRDTLDDLDAANSKFVAGPVGGDAVLELSVSVTDSAEREIRAAAPSGGYPSAAVGSHKSYWLLYWAADDIEYVPGSGYDELKIENAISTA